MEHFQGLFDCENRRNTSGQFSMSSCCSEHGQDNMDGPKVGIDKKMMPKWRDINVVEKRYVRMGAVIAVIGL
jgi:hypothetical protein